MQQSFYELADFVQRHLQGAERFTLNFTAENSDFIRFNNGKVRQPGSVAQQSVKLRLMQGSRHASVESSLSGDQALDREQISQALGSLRRILPHLPEDPHLMINEELSSSEQRNDNKLCDSQSMVDQIIEASEGLDMVGILASGGIFRGFANSFGQRNWFETYNFNLDWSLVHNADKAVKSSYAGAQWEPKSFKEKMSLARRKLAAIQRKPVTLKPGEYRVFLSPEALWSILDLLGWCSFGLSAQKSKTSPLIKLVAGEEKLHDDFTMLENVAGGASPQFQSEGFTRPDQVMLIEKGRYKSSLISPRTAKEYQAQTNGASGDESPTSIEIKAGQLDASRVIETLDTGVHVGNLWYLNYSDRAGCRITGMTRFATFWVEGGEVKGPLNVMRFDDTIYRILGSNLEALTDQQDFLLSASSYVNRSTESARLPGALVRDFRFTL
jgi:predicted Zn-dependent protease